MTAVNAPPVDISALASNLRQGADGIWVAGSQTEISYPEEGNYNCLALEADSFWFEHRNRCIQAVMRRWPPPGMVFDIGGGNGYVTLGLQRAGFPTALLEPGWQGVRNARQRGVETLVCSTLEDAGFHPKSLPAAGLFDVLEHIQDDIDFLKTIHGLLVPGGRLYLTVPAFQALWSADDDYAGHQRRYSLSGLRGKLRQAGFQINFSSYFFFMLPLPIFLMRAIPSRLGLRKQDEWDRYKQEHRSHPGIVGRTLNTLLNWELACLRGGHSMLIGGSCLIAAEKE